ncbi:DUF3388 domain-containing protein [Brevibacillus dissolubilis]|uniref:DUF3388 domain-containing protein n=1 Tax=Brevibacillus dissolubilis TaxID=1844116 RepID=UPI0011165CEB|nr:DUF3388 domain-containing protein [Brevibacillus dissolubilis]
MQTEEKVCHEWYMEYKIHKNRPGLLGDVASMLGMLNINIITINGVHDSTRGMLLSTDDNDKIEVLRNMLLKVNNITINKFRPPTLLDRLAVRHGRYIERDSEDKKTFRFIRDELGILVDFMAEIFKKEGNQLIGIRGMPRVGKTESMIAASVSANKRWTFLSSTLLRQTVRNSLAVDEMSSDHVYLIDGIVSTMRSTERHHSLLREMMNFPATKVIEHPDIFVRESEYELSDFHYIIELRHHPEEEITYELINRGLTDFDVT